MELEKKKFYSVVCNKMVVCELLQLIFNDRDGYSPMKMVQVAPKHVGVIIL
jgi:hypothetical protein